LSYRFASRDFTVYGLLPEAAFSYPPRTIYALWKPPFLHWTSFQFIYQWLSHPGPQLIALLQYAIIGSCLLGLIGIAPKANAVISFILATHLDGIMMASNAETEGETLILIAILILALSPKESFYRMGQRLDMKIRRSDYRWPVFLYLFMMSGFYTLSGLNKIIEVGISWPWRLHLENLGVNCIESSLFFTSRKSSPEWCLPLLSTFHASVSAWFSLVAEIGFGSILFFPHTRAFFVFSMMIMHWLVFQSAGINFLGNSLMLLLVFDWNVLVRSGTVLYNETSVDDCQSINWLRKLDWGNRLTFQSSSTIKGGPILVDEDGWQFTRMVFWEQIALRYFLVLPVSLILKFPGVRTLAKKVF
jgi:hypothetical protein